VENSQALSGIILAGGASRRLGFDKGLKMLAGKPLINYAVESLKNEVSEIMCVVGNEERLDSYRNILDESVRIVCDKYNISSPLVGLITGLRFCVSDYALVVACDMPFIEPQVIRYLFNKALGSDGAVIVKANGWIEPFLAVYKVVPCLAEAERLFRASDLRLRMVLRNCTNVNYIPIKEIETLDYKGLSLFDADTGEKFVLAEKIILGR
jgi:molybdopterin-guanine dinucleotide biosynthesis protein A